MFSCDKNSVHLMLLLVATFLQNIKYCKNELLLKFVKGLYAIADIVTLIFFTILRVVSMFMVNDEWCLYVSKFISRSVPSIYG